jgi:hypothetical protein
MATKKTIKKSASKKTRATKKTKIDFYQFVFLVCLAVVAIFGAIQVGMGAGK